ncbi:MAG: glycosyltransferase family 2 protein [bacterium]
MNTKISIIVPAHNEVENIPLLINEFHKIKLKDYEVIIIDDGSTDDTYLEANKLVSKNKFLKVIRHKRKRGITDALISGVDAAAGDIIVFFPADLQYLPEEISKLTDKINEGYDIVTGWKTGKYEKWFVSGIYNTLSRKLFNIPVHDLNSIKAFTKEVFYKIPLRKDWHRYMVVLAWEQGFNVAEVKVTLYPRKYGKSKFGGIGRVFIGVLDLLAVKFQISFMRKPMLFFGTTGGILLVLTFIIGAIELYFRFVLLKGFRPMLYLIMFLGLSGLIFFVLGFLAEAIAGIQDEIKKIKK